MHIHPLSSLTALCSQCHQSAGHRAVGRGDPLPSQRRVNTGQAATTVFHASRDRTSASDDAVAPTTDPRRGERQDEQYQSPPPVASSQHQPIDCIQDASTTRYAPMKRCRGRCPKLRSTGIKACCLAPPVSHSQVLQSQTFLIIGVL